MKRRWFSQALYWQGGVVLIAALLAYPIYRQIMAWRLLRELAYIADETYAKGPPYDGRFMIDNIARMGEHQPTQLAQYVPHGSPAVRAIICYGFEAIDRTRCWKSKNLHWENVAEIMLDEVLQEPDEGIARGAATAFCSIPQLLGDRLERALLRIENEFKDQPGVAVVLRRFARDQHYGPASQMLARWLESEPVDSLRYDIAVEILAEVQPELPILETAVEKLAAKLDSVPSWLAPPAAYLCKNRPALIRKWLRGNDRLQALALEGFVDHDFYRPYRPLEVMDMRSNNLRPPRETGFPSYDDYALAESAIAGKLQKCGYRRLDQTTIAILNKSPNGVNQLMEVLLRSNQSTAQMTAVSELMSIARSSAARYNNLSDSLVAQAFDLWENGETSQRREIGRLLDTVILQQYRTRYPIFGPGRGPFDRKYLPVFRRVLARKLQPYSVLIYFGSVTPAEPEDLPLVIQTFEDLKHLPPFSPVSDIDIIKLLQTKYGNRPEVAQLLKTRVDLKTGQRIIVPLPTPAPTIPQQSTLPSSTSLSGREK